MKYGHGRRLPLILGGLNGNGLIGTGRSENLGGETLDNYRVIIDSWAQGLIREGRLAMDAVMVRPTEVCLACDIGCCVFRPERPAQP